MAGSQSEIPVSYQIWSMCTIPENWVFFWGGGIMLAPGKWASMSPSRCKNGYQRLKPNGYANCHGDLNLNFAIYASAKNMTYILT